jgi:hypothetical protein
MDSHRDRADSTSDNAVHHVSEIEINPFKMLFAAAREF